MLARPHRIRLADYVYTFDNKTMIKTKKGNNTSNAWPVMSG